MIQSASMESSGASVVCELLHNHIGQLIQCLKKKYDFLFRHEGRNLRIKSYSNRQNFIKNILPLFAQGQKRTAQIFWILLPNKKFPFKQRCRRATYFSFIYQKPIAKLTCSNTFCRMNMGQNSPIAQAQPKFFDRLSRSTIKQFTQNSNFIVNGHLDRRRPVLK